MPLGCQRSNDVRVCFLKASRERGGAASYGGWRGLRAATHPEWRSERDGETEDAARWGVMGARLPCGFETDDAECYAVYKALRQVCEQAEAEGRDPADESLLLLSDCAPVVAQVEGAYRAETAVGLRGTDRGAMLEAICAYRMKMKKVVVLWAPSHEGVTPGAGADAAAKCSLQRAEEANLTQGVAEVVRSRPCLYERQVQGGAGWELYDRPTFRGARQQSKGWVEAKLAAGLREGAITAKVSEPWPALAAAVGKGARKPKGKRGGGGEGRGDGGGADADPTLAEKGLTPDQVRERNVYTAFTFGVRVGEVAGVRHGAQFARSRKAEAGTGGPCAREGMYGCAACWVQVRERRRAAACLQPAALQGVAVANQFAALPVEEPAVRHETLRHVITECEATEGKMQEGEGGRLPR